MRSKAPLSVFLPFYLLVLLTFAVAICSGIWIIYQFRLLSQEGKNLGQRLQQTFELNHALRIDIDREIILLLQQLEIRDPNFPELFAALNYSLGSKQIEYLRLYVGRQEGLLVESIRQMQSELGIKASHCYEQLLLGDRAKAQVSSREAQRLVIRIKMELEAINSIQLDGLRSVVDRLGSRVVSNIYALLGLLVALFMALVAFTFLLRMRILRPLRSVQEALDKIRQGNFATRARVGRNDEMGRLASEFNFMAESLEESYTGLEHKVEERTQQIMDLQQNLAQAAKLSAIGTLISGVAHELNNPLTAIMGFAEITRMDIAPDSANKDVLKVLDDIHHQADRCRRIVANLLQFARQHKPQLEAIRINEVIEHSLQLREYELSTRNIKLVREYDRSNPLICADPYKMQQVILNLLNNAYDSIQEAGRPGKIGIRTCVLDREIIIEISDTGNGLRYPEKVFEPFYTTKEVGKGTGLGLSICYGIIQEHGGEIRAMNWDEGARFIISFPIGEPDKLAKRSKSKNEQTSRPLKDGRQRHALIVDDEVVLLKLQKTFLSRMKMTSDVVATGEEAIRYLGEKPADVIISDVHMPGPINGVQLYEWLCHNRPELAGRFVFISGDPVALSTNEFFDLSAVPRLQKPFKFSEYSKVIYQVLET